MNTTELDEALRESLTFSENYIMWCSDWSDSTPEIEASAIFTWLQVNE